MLVNQNEKITVSVPWLGGVEIVEFVPNYYFFECWEASNLMKNLHGAKLEGIIKLKNDSPKNRATEMLNQVFTTDKIAFFIS